MRTSPFPQAKSLSSLHDKVSLLLTILQKALYVKCSQAFPWPRRGPGRGPGPSAQPWPDTIKPPINKLGLPKQAPEGRENFRSVPIPSTPWSRPKKLPPRVM